MALEGVHADLEGFLALETTSETWFQSVGGVFACILYVSIYSLIISTIVAGTTFSTSTGYKLLFSVSLLTS